MTGGAQPCSASFFLWILDFGDRRFQDVPVPRRLSQTPALREGRDIRERFRSRRIVAPAGIPFPGSQLVAAGYSGEPFSNRVFSLRLRGACRPLRLGDHRAWFAPLTQQPCFSSPGRILWEAQELLRHKKIGTSPR